MPIYNVTNQTSTRPTTSTTSSTSSSSQLQNLISSFNSGSYSGTNGGWSSFLGIIQNLLGQYRPTPTPTALPRGCLGHSCPGSRACVNIANACRCTASATWCGWTPTTTAWRKAASRACQACSCSSPTPLGTCLRRR